MKTVQGILGKAKVSYIVQVVKLITVRCHSTFYLAMSRFLLQHLWCYLCNC